MDPSLLALAKSTYYTIDRQIKWHMCVKLSKWRNFKLYSITLI